MGFVPGIIDYNSAPVISTWDPSKKASTMILSNGNLTAAGTKSVLSTVGKNSGKWYWEIRINAGSGGLDVGISQNTSPNFNTEVGQASSSWGYINWLGGGLKQHSSVNVAYGTSYGPASTIGVALDMDGGTVIMYKNGVSQGVMYSGITGTIYAAVSSYSGNTGTYTANFGETLFGFPVPSGYNPGLY